MKSNEEDIWVDVRDNEAMVALGIRAKLFTPVDCRTKTSKEKKELRRARHSHAANGNSHFNSVPRRFIPVRDKLIIYLSKVDRMGKSTISTMCWQSDLPQILSSYPDLKKYYWNGKTYKPDELPYWGFAN